MPVPLRSVPLVVGMELGSGMGLGLQVCGVLWWVQGEQQDASLLWLPRAWEQHPRRRVVYFILVWAGVLRWVF